MSLPLPYYLQVILVFMNDTAISNMIISKPGRYRDSLGVLLSAIPDIEEAICVDTVQDAVKMFSEGFSFDLIIINTDQDEINIIETLSSVKRLSPYSKMLVMADAAIWQKIKQVPEVDHVSLKGFSIHQLRTAIDALFGGNGKLKSEELYLDYPHIL